MTLRELTWMAEARAGFEGEFTAWLIRCIPAAIWAPKELPVNLNPFREPEPMSEAMQAHLAAWQRRKWRAASGG